MIIKKYLFPVLLFTAGLHGVIFDSDGVCSELEALEDLEKLEALEAEEVKIIDDMFDPFDKDTVPGATVAIFFKGKIIFQKAYGLANLEEDIPATLDTQYRLASMTKQFTAMAIMILAEEGLLDYDDSISTFFPDYPSFIGHRITVRHLLNHTSGVIHYKPLMPEDQTEPLSDQDVLGYLLQQHGTYFTSGTEFSYSNSGYALLALIVEKVSKKPFGDFLKEKIFKPLKMHNTAFLNESEDFLSHRAYGYKKTRSKGFIFKDQSTTSMIQGDGGLYSTVKDYFLWDQALYTNKLVPQKILMDALTPVILPDESSTEYGFGWRIKEQKGVTVYYHGGITSGFCNMAYRIPEKELTFIILTNRANRKAYQIAPELLEWLLENLAN